MPPSKGISIDIKSKKSRYEFEPFNCFIPNGNIELADIKKHCEEKIMNTQFKIESPEAYKINNVALDFQNKTKMVKKLLLRFGM